MSIVPSADEEAAARYYFGQDMPREPKNKVLVRILGAFPAEDDDEDAYSTRCPVNRRSYRYVRLEDIHETTDEGSEDAAALARRVRVFLYDPDSFARLAEDPGVRDVDFYSIDEAEDMWYAEGAACVHLEERIDVREATRPHASRKR